SQSPKARHGMSCGSPLSVRMGSKWGKAIGETVGLVGCNRQKAVDVGAPRQKWRDQTPDALLAAILRCDRESRTNDALGYERGVRRDLAICDELGKKRA